MQTQSPMQLMSPWHDLNSLPLSNNKSSRPTGPVRSHGVSTVSPCDEKPLYMKLFLLSNFKPFPIREHTFTCIVPCFLDKPAWNNYWKNTVDEKKKKLASSRTVLLIQTAEQIPLSCLSSWKFQNLPCDLHFLKPIQAVADEAARCRAEKEPQICIWSR